VRALGPSLSLPDKLANPILELRDSSGALVQMNDDWSTSPNRQAIEDSGLAPTNDFESAIIATLPANGKTYTAIVRGVGNTTGTGVVEVYDIDRSVDSELANISSRGLVQTGDKILIAGTIVVSRSPQKVIIRAIGPSLNMANKLANPTLELRDANGALVRADDDWRTGGQETEIIQTGVAPTNDLESALIETLAGNGAYTAIVRGVNDTTGIAVVEVYALN
jgi:pSer/pThr/pTyr-binding forkhead associated (FHA) protein